MKEIIEFLRLCLAFGYQVVKASSEQVVVSCTESDLLPMIVTNDLNYLTPTPNQWYSIKEEIKRIEKEVHNDQI